MRRSSVTDHDRPTGSAMRFSRETWSRKSSNEGRGYVFVPDVGGVVVDEKQRVVLLVVVLKRAFVNVRVVVGVAVVVDSAHSNLGLPKRDNMVASWNQI